MRTPGGALLLCGSALLGDLLGISRFTECDFSLSCLILGFSGDFCTVSSLITDVFFCVIVVLLSVCLLVLTELSLLAMQLAGKGTDSSIDALINV